MFLSITKTPNDCRLHRILFLRLDNNGLCIMNLNVGHGESAFKQLYFRELSFMYDGAIGGRIIRFTSGNSNDCWHWCIPFLLLGDHSFAN